MRFILALILVLITVLHTPFVLATDCQAELGAQETFSRPWLMSKLIPSQPLTNSALAQASQISNLTDFHQLSAEKKIALYMDLVRQKIRWSSEAATCPLHELATFDQVLARGLGNCQHMAVLLVAMLREGGYSAYLVRYLPENGPGHIWVEVMIQDGAGVRTFLADPTRKNYVRPLSQVLSIAAAIPSSIEARWYAHPDRLYD